MDAELIESRSAIVSAGLSELDSFRDRLEQCSRQVERAEIVKQGLGVATDYIAELGLFEDLPIFSFQVSFRGGTNQLFPVGAYYLDRRTRHLVNVLQDDKSGMLMWDRKKWIVFDRQLSSVGEFALFTIRERLQQEV